MEYITIRHYFLTKDTKYAFQNKAQNAKQVKGQNLSTLHSDRSKLISSSSLLQKKERKKERKRKREKKKIKGKKVKIQVNH